MPGAGRVGQPNTVPAMYTIEFAAAVAEDLAELRAHHRQRVLDGIDEQLSHQPAEVTRNRKPIVGLVHRDGSESPSRCASHASGIDTIITKVATTFTIGTLFGLLMLAKIHCGSVR